MDSLLRSIWGKQEGFVFLPRKKERWIETAAIPWPNKGDLDGLLDLTADSYFCPQVFREPRRVKGNSLPSPWLYADLDRVNPGSVGLRPTIGVQTSPGRYQGYWRLARSLAGSDLESLNQRLTYATGADRGGWHIGKVLRVPGTYNFKYPTRTQVKILWEDGPTYLVAEVEEYVKGVEAHQLDPTVTDLVLPAETRESILKRVWQRLDDRARELLGETREQPTGERSDRLWELECRLIEAGLEPEEVFIVVRASVWNKFLDRRNGDSSLWSEIRKAHLHVGQERVGEGAGPNALVRLRPRIVSYADLLGSSLSEPDWLVEDWWTLTSQGIVAGLPKSYKSLVSLDLAVSIASETPFLNQFAVNAKGSGPVLVVQQENSLPLIRDRLWKITYSRCLHKGTVQAQAGKVMVEFPPNIPLYLYNDFTFDMTMPEDRDSVEKFIQDEAVRMVVFDPLYLMIGGADESNSKEMRPILSWLLRIRNLYGCAVVVVHHWAKSHTSRGGRGLGGTRLLGSTTIYGWLEAALYLEASNSDSGIQVVVEREFRERLSPPPTGFQLRMGDVGEYAYEWIPIGTIGTTNKVIHAIREAGSEGGTIASLAVQLGLGQKKLRTELAALIDSGEVKVETDGRLKRFYLGDQ